MLSKSREWRMKFSDKIGTRRFSMTHLEFSITGSEPLRTIHSRTVLIMQDKSFSLTISRNLHRLFCNRWICGSFSRGVETSALPARFGDVHYGNAATCFRFSSGKAFQPDLMWSIGTNNPRSQGDQTSVKSMGYRTVCLSSHRRKFDLDQICIKQIGTILHRGRDVLWSS